jgi:predicted O-methyltransferase YrrM
MYCGVESLEPLLTINKKYRKYNALLKNDPRVETVLLPLETA